MANGIRANSSPASITLLTVVVVVTVLYFARAVFIPFALAVLLAFLLAPLVIRLRRWGLGRASAALIVVLFSFVIIGSMGAVMTSQLADLARKLPGYEQNIRHKMESIRASGGLIQRMISQVSHFADELTPSSLQSNRNQPGEEKPVPVEIRKPSLFPLDAIQHVLGSVLSILLTASIVIVFVIFMLIQREDLRDRLLRLIGEGRVNLTTQALDDAARRLSRYLVAQLVVNAVYGSLVAASLFFIQVPNPLLWGLLAALLRYIPYLGIWIAAAMPALVAFAVKPGWLEVPLIFGIYFGVDVLICNFVEPLVYGTSTGVSPIGILVAAVFWTWLWGAVGLLLATPLTVCLVVIGWYVPSLEFLSVILSDEPVLSPETRFYQRMLAMDLDEATAVADEFLKDKSLEELYDRVIIPALRLAEEDRHRGKLDAARQKFMFQNTRLLIDELAQRAAEAKLAGAPANANGKQGLEDQSSSAVQGSVLCIPARDEADEIAALMLTQLLDQQGIEGKILPLASVVNESLDEVERQNPRVTCVFAVPPFGYMHARYLCRRLHRQFPQLKLIGAIFSERGIQELRNRQPAIPADHLASSLQEALKEILSFISTAGKTVKSPVLTS